MSRRVHQVVVSASAGDAVTNEALAMRSALRTLGAVGECEIFARYHEPALAGEVVPLDEYARRSPPTAAAGEDVLVVHASIGEPAVAEFLAGRPERIVVVYHNISPSESFRPYDPAFADLLDGGRRELAELRPRVAMALADSAFNAADLESMGYHDVRVSPLVVDAAALTRIEPDPGTAHHLAEVVEGPVLLHVGQLLPHKRPDLLVQAYHVLTTYLEPEVRLVLVGPGRLPRYRAAVQHYVHELSLPGAWLAGPVSDAALAAFYRRADVFVTASGHEGFCVPVLEAMAFGVPVVARACGAIPETAGDAALLLPPGDDPVLLAEALATLLDDADLRASLAARGRERLDDFDPARSAAVFLGHVAELV
ncbi:MAG TPA: glycosyltransferase [Acidimicrobiales bacterium]|nr:glycosyltransferase [Acidimicrobiales bacterium]